MSKTTKEQKPIDISPQAVTLLDNKERNRVLNFLQRWGFYEALLACLEAINQPELVSMQDRQANALEGLGCFDEALAVRQGRVQEKESNTALVYLARCHLYKGDVDTALDISRQVVASSGISLGWGVLAEIHLASGDLEQAEAAYLEYQKRAPTSRQPAFGLAQVYQGRGDVVTAAAYAVRAYTVTEEDTHQVPISLLQQLRDFFARIGDQNRLREATEQLEARFHEELAEIEALLQEPALTMVGRQTTGPERAEPAPSLVSDLAQVPISAQERQELESAAQRYFGFSTLLEAQAEIMACARRGENVLAVLPTGGGKSLCYQLPALMDDGLTLVISPLIALMKDQIDGLPAIVRSQAFAINSSLDGGELRRAIDEAAQGRYRLLYVAPERLRQPPFLHALRQAGVSRLVIDEAHCVSVWGHDFRPDYLNIVQVHRDLGSPPVLAVTATAPPRVRRDIERRLFGDKESLRVIATDTYRPNLYLTVIKARNKDEKLGHLLKLCQELEGSGVIYAGTRRNCETLAALLQDQGISAEHYHAGINNRSQVQDRFMQGRTRVIVATVAFGMGVDKPDIRFIIHFGPPDSVESYYQEAGRAGRDGQPAHCILVYSSSDRNTMTRRANESAIPIEFLRQLYACVRGRLRGRPLGNVALDDLVRDLGSDDTMVRVGLSILEQAGLLQRHQDVPRTVSLYWAGDRHTPEVEAFAEAAHLRPGQTVTRNFFGLADGGQDGRAGQVPASDLENLLLQWQSDNLLRYDPNGRDALLSLLPAPADASTRIESLLSQYQTIQHQRVSEILAYARSRHCRHGYLGNYLGGHPRPHCEACDNCLEESELPDSGGQIIPETEQAGIMLTALSEVSWGRYSLSRLLKGNPDMRSRAGNSALFGKLAFRSQSALEQMIDRLIAAEYVQEVKLDHGGVSLELTARGSKALAANAFPEFVPVPPKKSKAANGNRAGQATAASGSGDVAAPLYEQLVAWRLETAQTDQVPPYVVAHNSVLEEVATQQPTTTGALLSIKGIGPAKLEKYGEQMLAIVRHFQAADSGAGSREKPSSA